MFDMAAGTRSERCSILGGFRIDRPGNDYKLQIGITQVAFNETISADRFVLQQPPETELVNVGEEPKSETRGPKTEQLIGHMIVQNVLHRPVRTAITLIGVAVEVTLVIIVVGLRADCLRRRRSGRKAWART